jgi:hypothetical protein
MSEEAKTVAITKLYVTPHNNMATTIHSPLKVVAEWTEKKYGNPQSG